MVKCLDEDAEQEGVAAVVAGVLALAQVGYELLQEDDNLADEFLALGFDVAWVVISMRLL